VPGGHEPGASAMPGCSAATCREFLNLSPPDRDLITSQNFKELIA